MGRRVVGFGSHILAERGIVTLNIGGRENSSDTKTVHLAEQLAIIPPYFFFKETTCIRFAVSQD